MARNKKIVFTTYSTGEDGRATPTLIYASYNEDDRDASLGKKPDGRIQKGEVIVDIDNAVMGAMAKLNAVDRLVLGLS